MCKRFFFRVLVLSRNAPLRRDDIVFPPSAGAQIIAEEAEAMASVIFLCVVRRTWRAPSDRMRSLARPPRVFRLFRLFCFVFSLRLRSVVDKKWFLGRVQK